MAVDKQTEQILQETAMDRQRAFRERREPVVWGFVCAAGCRVEPGLPPRGHHLGDQEELEEDPCWQHLYCRHVPDGEPMERSRTDAGIDWDRVALEFCPCRHEGLWLRGDWFDERRLAFEIEGPGDLTGQFSGLKQLAADLQLAVLPPGWKLADPSTHCQHCGEGLAYIAGAVRCGNDGCGNAGISVAGYPDRSTRRPVRAAARPRKRR